MTVHASVTAGRRWLTMTVIVGMVGGSFLLSGSTGQLQPASAEPLYARRQNAGGSAFVDGAGSTWVADGAYTSSSTFGFIGGTAFSTTSPIAGTTDDELYRSARSGSTVTYRFDVPNGNYTVLLKFAEIDPTRAAVGRRVFNVSMESTQVLTNFDVFAQVGANTALDRAFSTTVNDGALGIRFSGVTGGATVSAVQVISAEQVPQPELARRQNAGGSAVVDGTGSTWVADGAYTAASTFGFIGGTAFSTTSPIAGTTDDELYRSARSGSTVTYRFDVPNGNYTVLLKFAEIDPTRAAVGRRVFNVSMESTQVLTNFDVFAQVGANTALDRAFSTTVNDGALGIRFSGVTGGATVSAVQVISAEQVPQPDFSLDVTPASQTIGPGGSASYTVEVVFLNGFTSTSVDLSVGGLPGGVTGAFTPDPLTHEGRSVLALRADQSVVPGTYTLVTRATAEGMTRSRNVSLVISTSPDFALGMSPTTQSVAAGAAGTYQVSVTSINGFADPVRFSVSGLPSGVTSTFSPQPATPPADVSLRISTASATPGGEYAFTITGTAGTRTHSLTGTLVVGAPGSAWGVSVIGRTGSANNSVVVGPGRNDGVNRIYVGTVSTGSVMELSWNGTAWTSPVRVGGSPSGGGEIHNLGMGPGRNDGAVRIYACHDAGPLFELSYNGTQWSQATMGTISGSCTHAAVGRGRNDGVDRVYATRGAVLWEYTWTGSGWSALEIGRVSSGILHGLALGSARGGTGIQVYVASTDNGTYEARFSNGAWSMLPMGDSGDVRNVTVGAGRNDGIMRVYSATRDGLIWEFTRGSTAWTFTEINVAIGQPMVHAYVVAGRNDGVMRVYGAAGNGNAYEFTWNGSGWTSTLIGGGADYLYGFHFGRTRDGRNRLYGSNFGSEVLEFSFR